MRASSTRTGGKITIFAAYADPFEPAGKRDHHVVSEKTGRPQDGGSRCLADTPESTAARDPDRSRCREERPSAGRTPAGRTSVGRPSVFDEKWTQEALYNLLDNAVKYTDPGDWIEVCWTEYELFLRIDVTDHGIGIPEQETGRIFGRFVRGEQVRNQEGVGIGLYLADQIVTGEGGYLKVKSIPGERTTFSMFLSK